MTQPLRSTALALLLAALCAVTPGTARQQAPAPPAPAPATTFPEKLLEGEPDFNLAFLIQGDLRGNYGPCG